jgi:hypothetical protein
MKLALFSLTLLLSGCNYKGRPFGVVFAYEGASVEFKIYGKQPVQVKK